RVNLICPRQLANTPQPLKCRLIDDLPFPVIQRDESVNRTTDLVQRIRSCHRSFPLDRLASIGHYTEYTNTKQGGFAKVDRVLFPFRKILTNQGTKIRGRIDRSTVLFRMSALRRRGHLVLSPDGFGQVPARSLRFRRSSRGRNHRIYQVNVRGHIVTQLVKCMMVRRSLLVGGQRWDQPEEDRVASGKARRYRSPAAWRRRSPGS